VTDGLQQAGSPYEASLRRLYQAFNARDVDTVLDAMRPDVAWPNGWEGGRLDGRDEVRRYWARQWQEIDPWLEIRRIRPLPDDHAAVDLRQTVRSPTGEVIADATVTHVYRFADGLVASMEIQHPAG
jgi:nuclear transport factor 2 (NTF2) superfamily protein